MRNRNQSCRGFALLITVVLTAFLVLILVSLASFTRVETQVAGNSQKLQQARQNALFGLQVALGQLQKYAGPDQRVTARADLTATATNPATNPYYTGVWDAAAAATAAGDARTRTATEEANGKLNPVLPLAWLVSGNEIASLSPVFIDHSTASTDMTKDRAKELSGPVTLVKATAAGAGDAVIVPKVEITSDQMTGFSGAQPIGNYAYWVGDEGVKAKLNVVDPYTPRPAAGNAAAFNPTSLQSYYRGVSAQRFGLETVDDAATASSKLSVLYNPTANTVDSAILLQNLNKIIPYPSARLAGFDGATLTARFHDLTAYSNGLLTNTAAGGLRSDLSWHFAQPDATDGLDKASMLDLLEQATYPVKIKDSTNPKWQALKAFYNTPVSNGTTDIVLPSPDNTTNPIFPIFLQARFFFGCSSDASGTYLNARVAFVFANPYNVTLNVQPIRVRLYARGAPITITATPGTQTPVLKNVLTLYADNNTPKNKDDDPLLDTYVTPAFTLAPGKAKVFSLKNNTNGGIPDVELTEGLENDKTVSVKLTNVEYNPGSNNTWVLKSAVQQYHFKAEDVNTQREIVFLGILGMQNFTYSNSDKSFYGCGYTLHFKLPSEFLPPNQQNQQIRWLQDMNPRTNRQGQPATANVSGQGINTSITYLTKYNNLKEEFSSSLGSADIPWGGAVSGDPEKGKTQAILFNLPVSPMGSAPGWPAIISLGQLQHANISTRAWQPTYPIGNSYASLFTKRDETLSLQSVPSNLTRDDKYYDISYLLNEKLWDKYYFSSVPQTPGIYNPATDTLPNSRYYPLTRPGGVLPAQNELTENGLAAASRLLVNGAFNVNSTSVQAWRALFTSFRGLAYNSESNLSGPFPRTPYQSGASSNAQTVTDDNAWSGFRNLTDANINALATQMVKQVRLRGPFRSLGDFVNRRLMDPAADLGNLGLRGALQAAIDTAGLNDEFNDTANSTAFNAFSPSNVVTSRSTAAPGWLLQGDLLQGLAPILSARSDTFIIRAYGDSTDPISTANGATPPRVYCEAVVQRLPDFVSTADAADATTLNATNAQFGRRFVITHFRWLTESDL
ncbi:MAG: hypothetical protein NTU80_03345 [Verrucomicrobia bacterium]|nr:hypothetical protein [Verrucomicrobiota bacterium]